jgi:uncharacterized protein DUF4388
MTIPLFKKGVGEHAPSSSSPLPDASATAKALPEASDVSKAPTLRPPPLPSRPVHGTASSPPAEAVERVGSGFTSVIRHLSLRGWLQWIHANGSDAMLRVRTRDGGNGNIWCRAGQIVDAEWGQLTPEAALHEILRLSSGSVTIDFDPVERASRMSTPMHELLHVGGGEEPRVSELAQLEAALAASSRGRARDAAGRTSSFSRPGGEPSAAHASARSWWPWARHPSRGEYLAGGVLVAALVLAFAFGRQRGSTAGELAGAPDRDRAQQTKSLLPPPSLAKGPAAPGVSAAPRALPVIPFVVLEIEPANAEIWLDQARAGVGRLEIAPIPDGAMHELRFLAAGYQPRSLYFVGAPPAGRVVLERAADRTPVTAVDDGSKLAPSANAVPEVPTSPEGLDEGHATVKNVPRRRAPAPAPPLRARDWDAPDDSPSAAKAAPVKASPQIQVIEARTPRVQVLD